MKLLLHTCCAPCSGAIIETLLKEGIRPTIFYYNPNIYPEEEYMLRKNECSRYAAECGLEMVDWDNGGHQLNHSNWLCAMKGLENEPERGLRCNECFRYRLLESARYALLHGFDTLATTLASSRWKNLERINEAGRLAVTTALTEMSPVLGVGPSCNGDGTAASLAWWDRNWRKGGLQERRGEIIREKGFYNQTYCGCEFSFRG